MPVAVRSHLAVTVRSRVVARLAVALRNRTVGHTGAARRSQAADRGVAEARSRVVVRTGRDSAARRAVGRLVVVHLVSDPEAEVVASPFEDRLEAARLSSGLLVLDE
jgi:hypothetical protein